MWPPSNCTSFIGGFVAAPSCRLLSPQAERLDHGKIVDVKHDCFVRRGTVRVLVDRPRGDCKKIARPPVEAEVADLCRSGPSHDVIDRATRMPMRLELYPRPQPLQHCSDGGKRVTAGDGILIFQRRVVERIGIETGRLL